MQLAFNLLDPDHPRIRGEHSRVLSSGLCRAGSSPHTRGARLCPHNAAQRTRIIPAYAGSTWFSLPA